jgi:HEXXH motif-containing protein
MRSETGPVNLRLAATRSAPTQASRPGAVGRLLTLPNFGLWAAETLTRLRTGPQRPGAQRDVPPLELDIGHVAAFAAVAALRARLQCRLKLPIRDGVIHLPALGQVAVPAGIGQGWAGFVSDSRGATLASGSWEMRLPAAVNRGAPEAAWTSTQT